MNGHWPAMAKPWLAITTLYITKICTHSPTSAAISAIAEEATAFCLFGPFQPIQFRYALLLLWINRFGAGDCFSYKFKQLHNHFQWYGPTSYLLSLGSQTHTKIAQGFYLPYIYIWMSAKQSMLSWATLCSAQKIWKFYRWMYQNCLQRITINISEQLKEYGMLLRTFCVNRNNLQRKWECECVRDMDSI